MEVTAKRTCSWTVKKKTYEIKEGERYKFPASLKDYIIASNLFIVDSE